MADFLLVSAADNGNPVQLHPSRDYAEDEVGGRTQHLYMGGNQQIAYWPTRKRWTVPVTWVTSTDTFRVQDWWETGLTLHWTLSESSSPSIYQVKIANTERPLQTYELVNPEFYSGVLMLETIDNTPAT